LICDVSALLNFMTVFVSPEIKLSVETLMFSEQLCSLNNGSGGRPSLLLSNATAEILSRLILHSFYTQFHSETVKFGKDVLMLPQ